MGYLAAWRVLDEMITDFRKKGVDIPADIISNLRHARTLINVLGANPRHVNTSLRVEEQLRNVESYLVSKGKKKFGTKYVEEWLKRVDEASSNVIEEEKQARFVSGLPREQKWIRVKPTTELPFKLLKNLAIDSNLSFKAQGDGYLLVYGEEESIKNFIKKMSGKYR